MPYHDPRREIEKLRELLASHDRPLVFLIGAGASCAVRDLGTGEPLVPPIAPLGDRCATAVGDASDDLRAAYEAIAEEIAHAPLRAGAPANIEEILSAVRVKRSALGPHDRLSGVDAGGLAELERIIQTTIATAAAPGEDRVPPELPHHDLARWIGRIDRRCPVELFTTNYDTLIERALEDEWIPVFDGFVGSRAPFFSSASMLHRESLPGSRWTRLWKIHGSVTWRWSRDAGGRPRIVRGPESTHGELILPSFQK